MHQVKNCPICNGRGVAIAAIAARETSNGKSSGSYGGVGIGGGGLILGGGSYSGTRTDKTHRAEQFEKPAPMAVSGVNKAILGFLGFVLGASILYKVVPSALSSLGGGSSSSMSGISANLDAMTPIAFGGLGIALVVLVGLKLWKLVGIANDPAEEKRYAAALAFDKRRSQVHMRLRYCEDDHLVFDPETGSSASGEADAIAQLVNDLARN